MRGSRHGGLTRLGGGIRACLFDLDGVLTDTAAIHDKAWKQTFDAFLERWSERRDEDQQPFDAVRDYDDFVDGKPRLEGVRSFLGSRKIALPDGAATDSAEAETVNGLGNAKNELVLRLIAKEGVEPFPGSLLLLKAVREAGMKAAVVSSSANCRAVVEAAGLDAFFDARVDGTDLARCHLSGKPAPDAYLEAARRLAVDPPAAAVFEDALAGVQAGRAGNFGLVVGVDRAGQGDALRDQGADMVVTDLAELLDRR